MRTAATLLVGLGNPLRGDDGIGLRLARDLAAEYAGRAELEVLPEGPGAGLDLVERLDGYARAILVDAWVAADLPAGTLLHLDAGALGPAAGASHVHALEFATALELGRKVGLEVPAASEIHVLGVVARETDVLSESLSRELELAYPGLRAAVSREVEALVGSEPCQSGGNPWKSTG